MTDRNDIDKASKRRSGSIFETMHLLCLVATLCRRHSYRFLFL